MFKYVYINKDNQILNINGFKRLSGGRSLTKSQLRLLGLRKIKLTSDRLKRQAQATGSSDRLKRQASRRDNMKNNVVSKYLKIFGLSRLKQVVYIMRTSEDEYPRNKYLNWDDYIKTKNGYDNYFYICSNTIEELEYQINQQANEQKG